MNPAGTFAEVRSVQPTSLLTPNRKEAQLCFPIKMSL